MIHVEYVLGRSRCVLARNMQIRSQRLQTEWQPTRPESAARPAEVLICIGSRVFK